MILIYTNNFIFGLLFADFFLIIFIRILDSNRNSIQKYDDLCIKRLIRIYKIEIIFNSNYNFDRTSFKPEPD